MPAELLSTGLELLLRPLLEAGPDTTARSSATEPGTAVSGPGPRPVGDAGHRPRCRRSDLVHLLSGRLALAAVLLLPFGLSIGAAGAALAGWRPRLALMALGAAIAISFFLLEFGLVFGWPAWLLRLSVFELYGTPLVTGIWWPGLATIIILSAAGFGIAAAALQLRDIGQ